MQRQFLLLSVLCALSTALPRVKESVETKSEEPLNSASKSATTLSYFLSPSPTNSSLITTTTSPATTPVATTTSTTTTFPATLTILSTTTSSATKVPLNTTTLSTTTSSTNNLPLTTTTGATTSTPVATRTTEKPKSKVVNINHADDLTTTISKAGDKLVVIFVMTTWCPHSLRVVPTVEEVSNWSKNIIFLKVVYNKIDTSEDWKYGVTDVSGFPTFIFVSKGTKLEEHAGSNAERLKRKVIKHLIPRV